MEGAERKKLKIPEHNKCIATFFIAPKPWITILIVWVIFIVSAVVSWEVPASGAVLVCGALIAEILYQQQYWTNLSTNSTGTLDLEPDDDRGHPIIIGEFMWGKAGAGVLSYLISLSVGDEISVAPGDRKPKVIWYYHRTVARVSRKVHFAIVTTAVLGTLVWGYGHLVFNT